MSDQKITNEGLNEAGSHVQFRKRADSFINVANSHCEQAEPAAVNSSFLYGASRFCAFVVAGKTGSDEAYDAEKLAALDYYTEEFRKMLEENLEDYRRVFDSEI